eukprot:scaffold1595_cov171-Ochromonas_danica.AAC.2
MSSKSLLLQLPRDILHIVYSEWLPSWRDLSRLDVGCVGKEDREVWLCSLSELKMRNWDILRRLSQHSMERWYEWLISRKVLLVEMFPVRLSVFANLIIATELDFGSYCPSIRSIEITNDLDATVRSLDSSTLSVLEDRLYLFVKECIRLEGMCFFGANDSSEITNLILSALRRGIKANTLHNISINFWPPASASPSTLSMILQLLANQVSSMEDFEFSDDGISKESVDELMILLHENRSPLKKLGLIVTHISLLKLLECLSSVGEHLETLQVGRFSMPCRVDYVARDCLSTLGRSCPELKRVSLFTCDTPSDEFSIRKIYQLYELCSNFTSFHYSPSRFEAISINVNYQNELNYVLQPIDRFSREEKDEFLECMRLAILRSQCKLTVSNHPFCGNFVQQHDDWVLMKSKLSPYLTDLNGMMSESILIEAVKELPRLERLIVNLAEERFGDLSLSVLKEYGNGLKMLWLFGMRLPPEQCSFTDEMISKVILGCEMLEELRMPGAGQESVLAVKHHSRLRKVYLDEVKLSQEEMSSMLALDEREGEEKRVWRRLQKGEINGKGYKVIYKYLKGKGCWLFANEN